MSDGLSVSDVSYSVAQLKLYKQCPLRYQYVHIEKIKSAIQSVESFVGQRVHEALELLYSALRDGMLLPIGDVVTHYRRRWEQLWHRAVRVRHPHNGREWYRRYGEKCVRHYYTRYYPFNGAETVGVEWSFEVTLAQDSRYKMRGHVDRLTREDDRFTVHDYKTSPYVPKLQTLVQDPQPGLYQLAVQRSFPEAREVDASWHYLAPKRELKPTLSHQQLEQLQCRLIQQIDELQQTTHFAPRTSPACYRCEYRESCPAFAEYHAKRMAAPRKATPRMEAPQHNES